MYYIMHTTCSLLQPAYYYDTYNTKLKHKIDSGVDRLLESVEDMKRMNRYTEDVFLLF